jgi:hypothetical protein
MITAHVLIDVFKRLSRLRPSARHVNHRQKAEHDVQQPARSVASNCFAMCVTYDADCMCADVTQGTPNAATLNTTEAALSPPSMLPWLEGSFSGAFVPANLSDPFQVGFCLLRRRSDEVALL